MHKAGFDEHSVDRRCEVGDQTSSGEADTSRKLEASFLHDQRNAIIGLLSRGIAHEINTPVQFTGDSLYFLRGALDALQSVLEAYRRLVVGAVNAGIDAALLDELRAVEEEEDISYLIGEIPAACDRASSGLQRVAEMTRAMQAVGHPSSGAHTPADVEAVVRNVLIMARNEYKYVADVEVAFEGAAAVRCDSAILYQAVLGLLLNAADSVEESVADTSERGIIRIQARQREGSVLLTFLDSGRGISASESRRLFESCTRTSRRTGRELAMARAAVLELGGSLTFESPPEGGRLFLIRLPIQPSESPEIAS